MKLEILEQSPTSLDVRIKDFYPKPISFGLISEHRFKINFFGPV